MQTEEEVTPVSPFSQVREVKAGAPLSWLKKGWKDMAQCPMQSLFFGISFLVGGYLLLWVLRDSPQYIPAVTMGFLIVGPFMAMGLYEISRRLEKGEKPSLWQSMSVWRYNCGHVAIFSVILLVLYLVWARASLVSFAVFYSGKLPTFQDFMVHLIETSNYEFMIVFFGIGAVFAAFTFAISVISIPLMLDRGYDAVTATIVSSLALATNVGPMMLWAGLISLLAVINMGTLLIGFVITGPLLGHATWHAYRDLMERNPEEEGAKSCL